MNTAPNLICSTGIFPKFIYIARVTPLVCHKHAIKNDICCNSIHFLLELLREVTLNHGKKGWGALSRPRKTQTGLEVTCWVLINHQF